MNTPLDSHIHHQDGELHLEAVPVSSLAEQIPTPFYAYSSGALSRNIQACQDAFSPYGIDVHYAVKANSNLHVLQQICEAGLGMDLVSAGELARVTRAGVSVERTVFSGVGKTRDELIEALRVGVGRINVESAEELALLAEISEQVPLAAPVRVSLRVNPDVPVDTHAHITTGQRGNKFGIDNLRVVELVQCYAHHPRISIDGLAMHIGSQICDTEPYRLAIGRLLEMSDLLRRSDCNITHLDLGGGFGVDYGDGECLPLADIAACIYAMTASFEGTISVEPGRSLVANIGVLVSRVVHVKEAVPTPFLILDAGMNDLMRPALYQARHTIVPVQKGSEATQLREYDVVGPVCESTDTFMRSESMPAELASGDLVALLSAGAYCAVMSNGYNSRAIAAEVLIDGDNARLIRCAVSVEDQMALELGETLL